MKWMPIKERIVPFPLRSEQFQNFVKLIYAEYPSSNMILWDTIIHANYLRAHDIWKSGEINAFHNYSLLQLLSSFISNKYDLDFVYLTPKEKESISAFLAELDTARNKLDSQYQGCFKNTCNPKINSLICVFPLPADITQRMIYDFISSKITNLGVSKDVIIAILELLLDDKKHTTTWYELLDMGDEEFARLVTVYKKSGYVEYFYVG